MIVCKESKIFKSPMWTLKTHKFDWGVVQRLNSDEWELFHYCKRAGGFSWLYLEEITCRNCYTYAPKELLQLRAFLNL